VKSSASPSGQVNKATKWKPSKTEQSFKMQYISRPASMPSPGENNRDKLFSIWPYRSLLTGLCSPLGSASAG
jgi:hypothetical protein